MPSFTVRVAFDVEATDSAEAANIITKFLEGGGVTDVRSDHDAAYHERYEAEHGGQSCPKCRPWEVLDDGESRSRTYRESAYDRSRRRYSL